MPRRIITSNLIISEDMANKRLFKKFAASLGAAVAEEIMINYYCNEGIDREVSERCVRTVLGAVNNALAQANATFGKRVKDFDDRKAYNAAKKQFTKELFRGINANIVNAINQSLKEFNAVVPQSIKDRNKEAAQ